jgi:hypothetical protein
LAGVVGEDLVEALAGAEQLARVDVDIGRLPAQPLDPGLVNQDA